MAVAVYGLGNRALKRIGWRMVGRSGLTALLASAALLASGAALGCAASPAAAPDGGDAGLVSGGDAGLVPGGDARTATPAPDNLAPEDWVPFQCPSCPGPAGVRAVRCDGSAEITFGRPAGSGEITGARLTTAMLAVSLQSGNGWDLWTRRAGVWELVPLGAPTSGAAKLVGGPHVEAAFSGRLEPATRIVYSRSYDTGTDAVSYFDVAIGTGYDFFGQALPQADDLQIQFALLGDGRMAVYEFSATNQPPGDRRLLSLTTLDTFDEVTIPLPKPDQMAGLRDGGVAVLRDGAVTTYGPDGTSRGALLFSGRVTAIATVDSGALAFSSGGDLYCARSMTDVVRLTATPTEEALFP